MDYRPYNEIKALRMLQTGRFLLATGLLAGLLLFCVSTSLGAETIHFSGGPKGGTFQFFSGGIADRLTAGLQDLQVINLASAGSVENIRRVNSGDVAYGIAYSGDTYLARNGLLNNDSKKYSDIMAVAYLYGAPAHLITYQGKGIDSVFDLEGKRVAVGGAGSGAAASAQRYFTALGIWQKMKVVYIGYSKAAEALAGGEIDAFWILSAYPNPAARQAADKGPIMILDTWKAGEDAGLYDHYPFYTPAPIPAGTYRGVDYQVRTFQDSALWIARKHVNPDTVYRSVANIFTPEALAYLAEINSTARAMGVKNGLAGIVTPVHLGAIRFWTEQRLRLEPSHLSN